MAKRYTSTMRPDQPELQWAEGKLIRLDLNIETTLDELAALGYFTVTEDGAKCWCGGQVGPRVPGDDEGLGCLDSIYHDWDSDGRPKQITKLYVAGPMSGYPNNNYDAFNEAADLLRTVGGFEVVNPAEFGAEGGHYVDLIRKDLEMMLPCHGVATLENWWESPGARNEVQVAGMLKMPVRTAGEWIARRVFPDNEIRNATI